MASLAKYITLSPITQRRSQAKHTEIRFVFTKICASSPPWVDKAVADGEENTGLESKGERF